MGNCRKTKGLLAAAAYDDLSAAERTRLECHLSACDACRAEAEALQKLAAALPTQAPQLERDLWPSIRARLAGQATPQRFKYSYKRLAWAGVGCLMLICASAYMWTGPSFLDEGPATATSSAPTTPQANSSLGALLARADVLIDDKAFTEAVRLLLDFGFGELNLHRISLHVFEDNERARSVYRKAGFIEEGLLREAAFIDGRYRSVRVMGLLASERPAGKM